ncbi:hypothetical protein [Swaminathania salitolerans]|uniref:Uncharacterized protein n=1 Tax=Swaminathania salitolerans TaxID=182838 RepID=A0A511BQF1_9PROT|nr:hypothetical protein [Swaminathania salitolerans]GBQ14714.1 hypothetical protein AA21291_1933 [Swaminathania salitolerans LMG 21291]GEL01864.1 hypothetical protein SSA02_10270 [Swaminathania salitolerans]
MEPILDSGRCPLADTTGRLCAFGWENAFVTGRLSASAAHADLPVGNLATPQGAPATAWRAPGRTASVTLHPGAMTAWDCVSLHRTNLTATARWSVRIWRGATLVHDSGLLAADTREGQSVMVLDTPVTGDRMTLLVADAANPDGFLSLPLAYAGPLWRPQRNMAWTGGESAESDADTVTSLSGAEYVTLRWQRRVIRIEHRSLGIEELPRIRHMLAQARSGANILFIPDPGAATRSGDAVFGRCEAGEITASAGAANRRAITLTMRERL